MKHLLTLILVSVGLMATAQTGSFTSDGKTVSYTSTSVTTSTVKFSDGTVLTLTGSVAKAVVQKAYTAYLTSLPAAFTLVGTGSGDLDLGSLSDKKIKIKPGTYSHIGFSKATNVVIDATGVSLPKGYVDITNAVNVEFFGFTVTDQYYRAVNVRGFCSGLYLHDLTFKNIGNSVISYEYEGIWDGTDKTNSKDWKIENCSFTNTACAVSLKGGFDDAGIKTYMSGFRFINNKIQDCPGIGTAVYAPAADGYEIAGNVVNNINTTYTTQDPNGIHNGIFMMTGNGSFHNNKITNHQGNVIRAWGVSFGTSKQSIKIYNNVVWNSWKYGAFELQFIPFYQDYKEKYPNRITYTDAQVYSNTVGRMNVSANWEGQILDYYYTGGTLDYYSNLGFDLKKSNNGVVNGEGITDMINYNYTATFGRKDNNQYYPTATQAVKDVTTLKSLISGVGAQ